MRPITVLFALALAAAGLAACDTEPQDAGPGGQARPIASATSALPPKEALLAAVQALETTAHTFEIKQGSKSGGGRIDPATRTATMGMGGKVEKVTVSVEYTIIAPELWVKADFGKELNELWGLPGGTWMAVDRGKIASTATLPVDRAGAPRLGVTELFKAGLVEVNRADATHYSGTVDVTAADSVLAPSEAAVKNAGAKAKAMPFTATVDDRGRLTAFIIDDAGIDPELGLRLTFAGFGSILPVTAPADAIPAPAEAYELFD